MDEGLGRHRAPGAADGAVRGAGDGAGAVGGGGDPPGCNRGALGADMGPIRPIGPIAGRPAPGKSAGKLG